MSGELLRLGYRIRFRPGGHSMQPTIRDGEAVTVAPVNPRTVKRGDILLYSTGAGVIAHRVVAVSRDAAAGRYFLLRGDSSSTTDKPVAAHQVLGRIVYVEREGRRISLAGRSVRIRHGATLLAARIRRRLAQASRLCEITAGKPRAGI
ncbi:MAG TPA: hypothetical protein VF553_04270 [Pyrinomonadaceae bacterium]